MPRLLAILPGLFVAVAATSLGADAAGDALDRGLRAVQSMAGCYLDDGPRYQCAARWTEDTAYPAWTCSSYAPIPGRETRDMRRADYDTLDRTTRIVAYGQSWLERQDNVKTIHRDGARAPLAREVGKNWSIRLPESECEAARAFAAPRRAFWDLVREVWDGVQAGTAPFVETAPPGQPPRFVKMHEVEDVYVGRDLADPALRTAARDRIRKVIEAYREPAPAGRLAPRAD